MIFRSLDSVWIRCIGCAPSRAGNWLFEDGEGDGAGIFGKCCSSELHYYWWKRSNHFCNQVEDCEERREGEKRSDGEEAR